MAVSRKKFQEALRVLKSACKNDKLPMSQRIRAAELILCIYGCPLPESGSGTGKRNRRTVKALVEERAFEKQLGEQIRENVQSQVKQEAQAQAEAQAFLKRFSAERQNADPENEVEEQHVEDNDVAVEADAEDEGETRKDAE